MAGLICAVLLPAAAQGARSPNALEKRIVLTGKAAADAAALLGGLATGRTSVSLRLGRGEAWAVYLVKQDTRIPLSNDNNGSPARFNTIAYSASPVPTLWVAPYWLDLGTALPATRPGEYAFGSPFLSDEPDLNDPWKKIFQRLRREPGWNRMAQPAFRRCFGMADGSGLCLEAYSVKDYTNNIEKSGYNLRIVALPKTGVR